MNRREALAALVSLPEITRISTAPVKPDDVIVAECDAAVSIEMAERIKATLSEIWPGRKVVVCDQSIKIKVVGG